MLNRDKNILESLSKKYGKRYILNEVRKSDEEWDMEVYTTYGGIQYATEKTPEGWNFTVDGYDGGRRWKTKPDMEKVVGTRIKRIDRYKWSDDGDDWHEVIFPNRDPNYIGGVGKNNHRAIRESLSKKNYICEKFHGHGTKAISLEEIYKTLKDLGVYYNINAKDYPEVAKMCKHLSFYDEINDNRPKDIELELKWGCINFMPKHGDRNVRIYFKEMKSGERGTEQDLNNILKCLRYIVKEVEEEHEKYGTHPNMNEVKDFVVNLVSDYIDKELIRIDKTVTYEIKEQKFKEGNRVGVPMSEYGDGYEITISVRKYARGSYYNQTIGELGFWEDQLGRLHFSYSRGWVWDGDKREFTEWKDVEMNVNSFMNHTKRVLIEL
jgi:hypothetical protein